MVQTMGVARSAFNGVEWRPLFLWLYLQKVCVATLTDDGYETIFCTRITIQSIMTLTACYYSGTTGLWQWGRGQQGVVVGQPCGLSRITWQY